MVSSFARRKRMYGRRISGRDAVDDDVSNTTVVDSEGVISTSEPATENWYLLPVGDLSIEDAASWAQRFNEDGIPCHDVSEYYRSKAISFPAIHVNQVLERFNKHLQEYTLSTSSIDNLFIITFIDEDTEYLKPPSKKHFESWSDLVPVIKEVRKTFGVRLILDNPHGSSKLPSISSDENILYVHFWSAPKKRGDKKYSQVLGFTLVNSQCDGMQPSGLGESLTDVDGITFAEYTSDNLYILFDLPHGGSNVTEIFATIMQKFFAFKGKSEELLTEFYNSVVYGSVFDEGVSKDIFIKSCSKLYEKNLSQMEESLKEYDAFIDQHNKKLVEASRNREILLMKYNPLKNSAEERRKWAGNEYDILCASPHVKRVLVKGKTIQIFTDMISITHLVSTYNLGEFRIDIDTEGSEVKIYNLTHTRSGLAHPHIKASGYCCLGNISDGVRKLLADYQYVVLAQLMITYLQSYNPESAYGRISLWSE